MACGRTLWLFMAAVLCFAVISSEAAPGGLLDALFSGYGGETGRRSHRRNGSSGGPRASGGRSYKQICRVINPDPYAVHGRGGGHYPSGPLCPY